MRRRAEALARRHRRAVAVSVALVLVSGLIGWVDVARDRSTAVPLAEAVARFRAGAAPTASRPAPAQPASSAVPGGVVPGGTASVPAPPSGATPGGGRPAQAVGPVPYRPAPGVYTYRTEGRDEISILGAHHDYPSETHATVTHGSGCRWDVEHPLVEEHVEREERCTDAAAFRLIADSSEIEYFGRRDRGGFRCDPPLVLSAPGDRPGTRRTMTCPGDGDDEADFAVTVRGAAPVAVAGRPVPAVHVTIEVRMRGRATGSARAEVWLHHRSGLPLRVTRTVDTAARTLFGDVHYRERLHLELRSLEPSR